MLDVEVGGDPPGDHVPRILDVAGIDPVAERIGIIASGPAGAGLVHIIAGQQEAQFVGRFPQYLRPRGDIVFRFGDIDVLHRADIVVIAVVAQPHSRQAHRDRVANRDVEHPADHLLVVIAIFAFDFGIPHAKARLPGDDVDRSRGGVAAAKRTLRPDVDLDSFDIEEGRSDSGRTRQIDAIPMGRGGGIAQLGIVARPDSADPHFAVDAIVGNGQPRQHVVEIADILDAALLQLIAGKGGGGAGIILKFLFAPVSGDDDFLAIVGCRRIGRLCLIGRLRIVGGWCWRRLIGLSIGRRGERGERNAECEQCANFCHRWAPSDVDGRYFDSRRKLS